MAISLKDRLLAFLTHLGVGQSKFEKEAGLSNGLINNIKAAISTKTIDKIAAKYPQLNIAWLLHGEGEMLKQATLNKQNAEQKKEDGEDAYILQRMEEMFAFLKTNLIETRKGIELTQALAQAGLFQGAKLEALQTRQDHHSVLKRLNAVAAKIFDDNYHASLQTSDSEKRLLRSSERKRLKKASAG